MRSTDRVDELEVEVGYYRDRVALLRARLYRRGTGTNARLEELMRSLEGAEGRLQRARGTAATVAAPGPSAALHTSHAPPAAPATTSSAAPATTSSAAPATPSSAAPATPSSAAREPRSQT